MYNDKEEDKEERIDGYIPKYSHKKFEKSNISELDRKHKIRSSARSTKGTIPNYGANPRFSNDADEHAIEKYKMSKKYKNIDIDSSLKDIKNETKKRILTERLKQGKNISGNISKKLVNKKEYQPVESERDGRLYFHKTFDADDDAYQELLKLFKIMKSSNDYPEYKIAHDKFAKITGYNKTTSFKNIRFSKIKDNKRKLEFYPVFDGLNEKTKKDDKFYHGSKTDGIKNLTPTFKSTDGVFYATPRIYFNKNFYGSKISGSTGSNSKDPQYFADSKIKKVKVDNELHGNARYVTTTREIPVKKV